MSQKQPRIMLIDDEEDITYVLKRGLELKGFKVDGFANPLQAAGQFRSNYYDAVITDIRMPDLNGLELYEKIREKDAAVRVYLMSAFDRYESEVKDKFPDDQLVVFVKKPITYAALAEMLKKDIGKKRVTSFVI